MPRPSLEAELIPCSTKMKCKRLENIYNGYANYDESLAKFCAQIRGGSSARSNKRDGMMEITKVPSFYVLVQCQGEGSKWDLFSKESPIFYNGNDDIPLESALTKIVKIWNTYFKLVAVCKDSYVVYACGFDRNGKWEWICESKWRCKNDVAMLHGDSCCTLYKSFNLALIYQLNFVFVQIWLVYF